MQPVHLSTNPITVKKDPFQVSVEDQYRFEIQPDAVKNLDVIANGTNAFHVLEEGRSFHIKLLESDFARRRYTLQVDGIVYTAHISDYYERLIKKLGLSIGGHQKMNMAKAPMPGLVIDILVEPGQSIQKDEPMIILEAMKMENIIKAEGDGVVKTINAQKGQSVDKGHILIEFE